ncbi:MAG: DUF1735 domain-containing protein [Peptococcaceae bacterium]|nr:DUF1735 domain-containing protein [Peptococcaceae bacterium]
MKGKSKKAMLFISLALILSTALFGTLAYLTSEAKVTNTFTVGNVELKLDEAIVDEYGNPLDAEDGNIVDKIDDAARTEEGNEYKLIPGKTYTKDPTVTVKAGSEEAYVRMLVTVNCADELDEIFAILRAANAKDADLRSIFEGHDETVWMYAGDKRSEDENGKYITYEFRYKETVDGVVSIIDDAGNVTEGDGDVELTPLFDSFTLPGLINNDQLKALYDNGFEMVVTGHAIQAEGFDNADAAWAGFDDQMRFNPQPADDADEETSTEGEGETPVKPENGEAVEGETPAGVSGDDDGSNE